MGTDEVVLALHREDSSTTASVVIASSTEGASASLIAPSTDASWPLPADIPSKGSSSPNVEIVFDDETYFLPKHDIVDLLQRDGSIVTLLPYQIAGPTATVTIPQVSGPKLLTSDDISFTIEARPYETYRPSRRGFYGWLGFIHVLKELATTALKLSTTVKSIEEKGSQWAAGCLPDDLFASGVKGLFNSGISNLDGFVKGVSGVIEQFGEVYEQAEEGWYRIYCALHGAVELVDILKALRKLLTYRRGLRDTRVQFQSYWTQGTLGAATLAATEEALRNFGTYRWSKLKQTSTLSVPTSTMASSSTEHVIASISKRRSSTGSSSSSSSAETLTSYMLTTKSDTDCSIFYQYIKTLPDQGLYGSVIDHNVDTQSYVTWITAEQAEKIASDPIVDQIYPVGSDDCEDL